MPGAHHFDPPPSGRVVFQPPVLPPDAPLLLMEFWRLWQAEQFYQCHEVLEELWRATPGPQRQGYNGLIHCAVAVYQHRRGNAVGAARQWVRAQVKLASFRPAFMGADIEALLRGVQDEIAPSLVRLTAGQRAGLDELKAELTACE